MDNSEIRITVRKRKAHPESASPPTLQEFSEGSKFKGRPSQTQVPKSPKILGPACAGTWITTDHSQPVASVANGYGIHFNKVIFTIGADFKTLVAVQGVEEKQYDEIINVGDLLNPVFEKRTIRVVDERFQCNSATAHN